ncbi:BRO family protein [uncultured Anaerococcus sp.]|uniref:BRO-N domain-containing protein n=1 Tax=uncultured Anaerococcus sp. TaxID=293428 RepID=UPI00288939E7|nr:BRO family protein [uncultured Anaerococcus sp.]
MFKSMMYRSNLVEIINFKDKILFNPYDVGNCLDMKEETVRYHIRNFNENQVIKIKKSDVGLTNNLNIPPSGRSFLTESGVYKLSFKSRKPEAEKFTDWVTDEVLPSIRKTGKYEIKGEQLELDPYKLEKKTYKGKPVLIVRDLEYLTGQAKNNLNWIIKTQGLGFLLQGRSLDDFKYENKSFYNMKYSLNILFEDDVYNLIKRYDVDSDKLEDVDKYFETDSKEKFNKDVDLYIRLRDLKNLYRSLGLYEINNDLRKKITRIISEELVRLGVLDKPRDDFSLGSAEVWNMESEISNLRLSLSKGKDYTKNILELAAECNN